MAHIKCITRIETCKLLTIIILSPCLRKVKVKLKVKVKVKIKVKSQRLIKHHAMKTY